MEGKGRNTGLPSFNMDNKEYNTNADKAEFSKMLAIGNHSKEFASISMFLDNTWKKQAIAPTLKPHELDSEFEQHELIAAIKQSKRG